MNQATAEASPQYLELVEIAADQKLIADLRELQTETYTPPEMGEAYFNSEIAKFVHPEYSSELIDDLESHLSQHGALDIPIVHGAISVDGVTRIIPLVAATETDANHGEMSSMLYLRDHIQTSRALLELHRQEPERSSDEGELGRELLLSALHLMSTRSQLERFEHVIKTGKAAEQKDWPQISLYFNDLEGNEPNGWRNIQDTLQMLGHLTFDSIEKEFIKIEDLSESNKQFLGMLVPFMKSVGYPSYENSGSWEEFTAARTSVMSVETAMLAKIESLADQDNLDFLHHTYEQFRPEGAPESFNGCLNGMISEGLSALGKRLPYESAFPDYNPEDGKYREADAALVYVLMYDLPQLLADAKVPIGREGLPKNASDIEDMILEQLDSLVDPLTGGMKRYKNDSYQRTNFHTRQAQRLVASIKQHIQSQALLTGKSPDLDEKQSLRDRVVPIGREAAWTHPVSQISAWAARRSIEEERAGGAEEAQHYRQLSTKYLNQALRLVTGQDQYTAALQANGDYQVQKLPAYKLPECFVSYRDKDGEFVVGSPHTPLNWSTAMLREAVGLLGVSTNYSSQELPVFQKVL